MTENKQGWEHRFKKIFCDRKNCDNMPIPCPDKCFNCKPCWFIRTEIAAAVAAERERAKEICKLLAEVKDTAIGVNLCNRFCKRIDIALKTYEEG